MDLCLMISSIEKWLANCPSGCGCGDRESAYVTKGGYLGGGTVTYALVGGKIS